MTAVKFLNNMKYDDASSVTQVHRFLYECNGDSHGRRITEGLDSDRVFSSIFVRYEGPNGM